MSVHMYMLKKVKKAICLPMYIGVYVYIWVCVCTDVYQHTDICAVHILCIYEENT